MTDQTSKLYYDDTCPICTKEMCKLGALKDKNLELIPISSLRDKNELNIHKEQLFEELHIQDENGRWIKGLDANIKAWRHTHYARWVGLLNLPLVYHITKIGYSLWLKWYQKQRAKRLQN